jgi:hypothetical protein
VQRKTKRMKERELMTTRLRKSTLFRYRIIVTMPPWSVFLLAGAIALGLMARPMLLVTIISIITTALSLILVTVARRQVTALRYDVHEALNNIGNDDLVLEDFDPDPEPERIVLKRMNGKRSSRVSESG